MPDSTSRTIYYLNHTSWWDGLIPFLLNQKLLKQKARAMMEDKQMREHNFFQRIGAFSVNLQNSKSLITSLRYAVHSMERPQASLFIYPEGEIVPFNTDKPNFKKGLAWIAEKCPDVDIVPIGIYIHTAKFDKPELFIKIGKHLEIQEDKTQSEIKLILEKKLQKVLIRLVEDAHSDERLFTQL
tara:strand:+ start:4991 stop:5542 length:552 start_codon:yes stop_codon:yes gene_type:complete